MENHMFSTAGKKARKSGKPSGGADKQLQAEPGGQFAIWVSGTVSESVDDGNENYCMFSESAGRGVPPWTLIMKIVALVWTRKSIQELHFSSLE